MNTKFKKNILLGLFTLIGATFLILLLYTVGKNKNLFGSNYVLKARFENVQGLRLGDNVRFAGINVGTVNKMSIINDSVIEISMRIENNLKNIIKKNSIVSIGTDGLVGNKVVYIFTNKENSPTAKDGDVLFSKKPVDTDEMLKTLNKTNNNISVISDSIRGTMIKINSSEGLWNLLNETKFHDLLLQTLDNINNSSEALHSMTTFIKYGKGNIGKFIYDSSMVIKIKTEIDNFENAISNVTTATDNIVNISKKIKEQFEDKEGNLQKILTDSFLYKGILKTIDNAEKGTENFNLNMKALQHNFLFKNYFKKINKVH